MFSCNATVGLVSRSAFAGNGHTGALSNGLVVLRPDKLGGFADLTGLQGQEDVSSLLIHTGYNLFGVWKDNTRKKHSDVKAQPAERLWNVVFWLAVTWQSSGTDWLRQLGGFSNTVVIGSSHPEKVGLSFLQAADL